MSDKKFEREDRYLVFKYSDLEIIKNAYGDEQLKQLFAIHRLVNNTRKIAGKDILQCAVVEHDWPEYEVVWKMIENRVNNNE